MACHGVSRHEVPRGTGAEEQGAAVADQNGQEKQAVSHLCKWLWDAAHGGVERGQPEQTREARFAFFG